MELIFMGTPDFAVPCLDALIKAGHHIKAVYTQPDKPKGRGHQLTPPPVKELALAHGIPVRQPATFKENEAAISELRADAPQLIVVVAYGKILPKAVLDIPPLGCVNVHGSLLPKYRGAGPIQWSVINGDALTGITTMFMGEGLDTGDMILKKNIPIGPRETSGELFERMATLGASCLMETIALFEEGNVPRQKQDDSRSSYAPMLNKEMARLDFNKSMRELDCLIRGLNPWPVAVTELDGKLLKVYAAEPVPEKKGNPGELLDQREFLIGCGDGALRLTDIALAGKKRMSGADFLRGYYLQKGKILG